MPYDTLIQLPSQVRKVLPEHGQEIFRTAYNNAWDEYDTRSKRKDDDSREKTAHKVAWAAVKETYHENKEGKWIK